MGILDDHELLLDSMISWIAENAPEFEVVVRAERWVDLVRSENFPTALVLMDFQLVEPVSVEARIRTCRAAGAAVIVMSALDPAEARIRALDAGAAAFISKTESMHVFRSIAREVMGLGRVPSATAIAGETAGSEEQAAEFLRPKLSRGELEALQLYVAGNTTAAVARLMNVKYETAKTYLRRVREKYARANRPASRRADLILRAAEDGYLQ
ncbi:LuxR family two component transcriptional regulator [Microterricola gilva]|uniref:LuxR family two component transcriptional regulator n=1 Tax=Microterricola gilva TaxID=393267 RepID=A0A4Q8AQ28_9MICO|nr:LuxR family two component transcriptional regulator [Microterricola gilva]